MNLQEIKTSDIKAGEHEQRISREDEGTKDLVTSIRRLGILVPLIVRREGDGYILVAGHRRLTAAREAGLDTVPVIVKENEKVKAAEITFAENFFRKELSPVELACAIRDCIESGMMDIKEVAAGFHRAEGWVRYMMEVAAWPDDVLAEVHAEGISLAAAGNIAKIQDPVYRSFLMNNAVENGATARTTSAWLQAYRASMPAQNAVTQQPVPAGTGAAPIVPAAPCFCCSEVYGTNEMSHVPVCPGCIKAIRGAQGGGR